MGRFDELNIERLMYLDLKTIGFVVLCLCIGIGVSAQDFKADDIVGTWLTSDKTGEITVYKDKNKYYGRITAGTSKEKFDIHNPDKQRRNDPLIGMVILKDLKFDSDDGAWEDGTVYDPQNGKRYSCNVKLIDHDKLKITGYIGFSWISRSVLAS